MNIYKVSRLDEADYDEYDSFVCTANTEAQARNMHPRDGTEIKYWKEWDSCWIPYTERNDPKRLKVELIGKAEPDLRNLFRIVCASFNAG